MKLTLAITVYNRYDLLLESFANVIDDDRIDEVLIMDDASEEKYWNKIKELPKFNPKIKVVRQLQNRGMSINKRDSILNAKNETVLVFDSDNVLRKNYLDALQAQKGRDGGFREYCIYLPDFAKPNFDYRRYRSHTWGGVVGIPINEDHCFMATNTCNYVVNKTAYLEVWKENPDMKATDTLWFAYLWMKVGNIFYVVPGMDYEHRVHEGSGYLQDAEYNSNQGKKLRDLIYNHYNERVS